MAEDDRPRVKLASENVRKMDQMGTPESNARLPEDEFKPFYIGGTREAGALEPPHNLVRLDNLVQQNNTLEACIEAYVTNIDGTGFDFLHNDDEEPSDYQNKDMDDLRALFEEPWPGQTFLDMRKQLRRDVERTGNAYLEVIRNLKDEITFLRRVDPKMMRLIRLDEPVRVKKEVVRRGTKVSTFVNQRERRFVQSLNGIDIVYFKEFGASRDVDKDSGTWGTQDKRLPAEKRGTEILHMTCLPDSDTPYGVPRWLSQLPSVLGSRKAEEFNLEYFDNGGIPPALIILQGGTMQTETRRALEDKMTGRTKDKNRIEVLEVEPAGGSLDKASPVRVSVERFGGERNSDSMFEKYDDKCERRVRRAFRLPPMYMGAAEDFSYATAFVSRVMTEAQVFRPERDAFDKMISMVLMPALGYADYRMKSKQLQVEDVNAKMKSLEMAQNDPRISDKDFVWTMNEVAGFDFSLVPPEQRPIVQEMPGSSKPGPEKEYAGPVRQPETQARNTTPGNAPQTPASTVSKTDEGDVYRLASKALEAARKRDFPRLGDCIAEVQELSPEARRNFQEACAKLQFVNPAHDPDGLAELTQCTIGVMARETSGAT